MDILETIPPQLVGAILAVVVFAFLGFCSAIRAVQRVAAESFNLQAGARAFSKFARDTETLHNGPNPWLDAQSVETDSHFGDFVRIVWGSWLHGRSANLEELRATSRSREFASRSNGISRGVVALLLIVGIAGTLFAIKPILSEFHITVAASGETENASESADKVNLMINSLGTAFLPSLVALVATVLISSIRGIYLQRFSMLSKELDQFALEQLFPLFRSDSFARDLQEVNSNLSNLNDQLKNRDSKFGEAVEKFSELVLGFEKIAPAIRDASKKLATAEKSFLSVTKTGVKELEDAASGRITELTKAVDDGGKSMAAAVEECGKLISKKTKDHELRVAEVLENSVSELDELLRKGDDSIRVTLTDGTAELVRVTDVGASRIAEAIDSAESTFENSASKISQGVDAIQEANNSLRDDVSASLDRNEKALEKCILNQEAKINSTLQSARASFKEGLSAANKGFAVAEQSASRLDSLSREIVSKFDSLTELLRSRERFWQSIRRKTRLDTFFSKWFGKPAPADD